MAHRVLSSSRIIPVWDSIVVDILDVNKGKVTGVRIKNVKTNEEKTIDCAGVFIAIGHIPNTTLFKGVIEMDENGYIITRNGASTNIEGIFAAGDCVDHKYRQAITAAGMGCTAAIETERYLAEIG